MAKNKNFNKNRQSLKVLICPLDWGLGHATRCIPIIHELFALGFEVIIAAEGSILDLLKKEFPLSLFLSLPGYNIKYAQTKRKLKWKLFFQIPKIVLSIIRENLWLSNIIEQYGIGTVISDNRFGLFNTKITSIYITHQLEIKSGNFIIDRILQRLHYFFINKFNFCWVPDCEFKGLGGELSHPARLPNNTKYIGPLSRFINHNKPKVYDIIIIISGPEPQRSIFENLIIKEAFNLPGKILLIRGTTNGRRLKVFENCEIMDLVPGLELNTLIEMSSVVICRSGYTSVMDLSKLKKKAILIPTPGQTEQEYLAKYLMVNNYFLSIQQSDLFQLKNTLYLLNSTPFFGVHYDWNKYKLILKEYKISI